MTLREYLRGLRLLGLDDLQYRRRLEGLSDIADEGTLAALADALLPERVRGDEGAARATRAFVRESVGELARASAEVEPLRHYAAGAPPGTPLPLDVLLGAYAPHDAQVLLDMRLGDAVSYMGRRAIYEGVVAVLTQRQT